MLFVAHSMYVPGTISNPLSPIAHAVELTQGVGKFLSFRSRWHKNTRRNLQNGNSRRNISTPSFSTFTEIIDTATRCRTPTSSSILSLATQVRIENLLPLQLCWLPKPVSWKLSDSFRILIAYSQNILGGSGVMGCDWFHFLFVMLFVPRCITHSIFVFQFPFRRRKVLSAIAIHRQEISTSPRLDDWCRIRSSHGEFGRQVGQIANLGHRWTRVFP